MRASAPTGRRRLAGLTLAEVMITLVILAMVATSIVAVTFRIRSMAEQTVYQNTALVLAQGYVEQLRSLDYTTLVTAAQDGSVALSLTNASGNTVTATDNSALNNNDWAGETVFLDEAANGTPIQPLLFRFQPVLTNLATTNSTTSPAGVEITVNYSTTYNFGQNRTLTGSLRTVRSGVPTY